MIGLSIVRLQGIYLIVLYRQQRRDLVRFISTFVRFGFSAIVTTLIFHAHITWSFYHQVTFPASLNQNSRHISLEYSFSFKEKP